MAKAKEMPTGVKVISVLFYIGAALMAIFGLISLFGGSALGNSIPLIGALGGALFIVAGIVMIGFAVLYFFIAKGLWNGESWARITAIVLSCLGVLFAIIGLGGGNIGSNLVSLIINGAIGGYLWFSNEAKTAFA